MKLATVCPPSSPSFLANVEKALLPHFEVRRFDQASCDEAMKWGDVVWCEWAVAHAVPLSCGPRPLIVRLHRYELWTPHIRNIRWANVRLLVVGSTEIRDLARGAVPAIADVPTLVMPAPMDLDLWPERTVQPDGRRIGVVANFDARKNPFAWLEVLRRLPGDHELHVVGDWKDEWIRTWWDHAVKPYAHRVHLHGKLRHDQLAAFWADKRWCLAAGLHETAGPMAALEAAACGVWPVVYEFRAAREFWGDADVLWSHTEEAADLIRRDSRESVDEVALRRIAVRHSIQARGPELVAAVRAASA